MDGTVWASGIQWLDPTLTKQDTTQRIHAALAEAGVSADAFVANATYVSTKYGVANHKLAGDSFSLTFSDLAAAMQLVFGRITLSFL